MLSIDKEISRGIEHPTWLGRGLLFLINLCLLLFFLLLIVDIINIPPFQPPTIIIQILVGVACLCCTFALWYFAALKFLQSRAAGEKYFWYREPRLYASISVLDLALMTLLPLFVPGFGNQPQEVVPALILLLPLLILIVIGVAREMRQFNASVRQKVVQPEDQKQVQREGDYEEKRQLSQEEWRHKSPAEKLQLRLIALLVLLAILIAIIGLTVFITNIFFHFMNDTYATVLFIGASIIVVFLQVLRTVLNKRLKKGKLTRQDWQPFILLLAAIIFVLLLFEHSFIPQYHLSFISTPLVIINGVLLVFLFGCILLASWRGDDRATHTAMIQE